jgi:ribosomal-protein-alanine N-acetyltransferase
MGGRSGAELVLRGASLADYADYVRLHAELGTPDPPASPEIFAGWMLPGLRLLTEGDRALALVWWVQRGDALHIKHLITDPDHRRRGLGRRLMLDAAAQARALGLRRWLLNVKPENTAARHLYRALGFAERAETAVLRLPWAALQGLPPSPPGADPAPLPADLESIPNLGFPPGELADLRTRPGVVWWGIRAGGGWAAAAGFDPTFPGATPFRAEDPGAARALLEALRPFARPDDAHLFVVVEGDPALEAALLSAGATETLRVIAMDGPLPDGA